MTELGGGLITFEQLYLTDPWGFVDSLRFLQRTNSLFLLLILRFNICVRKALCVVVCACAPPPGLPVSLLWPPAQPSLLQPQEPRLGLDEQRSGGAAAERHHDKRVPHRRSPLSGFVFDVVWGVPVVLFEVHYTSFVIQLRRKMAEIGG